MFKRYRDVILAVSAFLIIGFFLMWLNKAEAGEFFPGTGRIGIGVAVEADGRTPPFCNSTDYTGDIYGEYDTYVFDNSNRISLYYLHNSCFEEQSDFSTSDRVGIRFVWEFK